MKQLRKNLLPLALFLMSTLVFTGCRNAEGRRVIAFMPNATLNQQGVSAYNDLKKKTKTSTNSRWTKINNRVGKRIIAAVQEMYPEESKGFKWEVTLFDEPETINAFCMPGGKIGIYTGIFKACKTEAGLAAVMGHEVAHALLKHSNERFSHNILKTGALIAGGYALNQSDLDQATKNIALSVGSVGLMYGFILPYSRAHETESDNVGLKLMAKAGYEPSEATNVWRRMKSITGSKTPEFLSTHPSHDRRIRGLDAKQSEVKGLYAASPKYGKGETL